MRLALLLMILAQLPAVNPAPKSGQSLRALLNSLDPQSLTQHMAFYELYPETKEGQKALAHAWKLLNRGQEKTPAHFLLPLVDLQVIVQLITREASDPTILLAEDQLAIIHQLAQHFPNRQLKGAGVWTREEVLALPNSEIDLGRGLLIEQFEGKKDAKQAILQYEANIDLMALQIAARLPQKANLEEKIRAINHFVFQEMHFRFPPHSLYAKDIDLYTFLPSVLDSRQGVCLGVSILYLCLAQRLGLPLEIITPPGHIYVRCPIENRCINIETTARGIDLPDQTYLGINTRKLQRRTVKEVIGMAFVNQASVFWGNQEFEQTVLLYEKALSYLPDDSLVQFFLGINYLFVGRKELGHDLLTPLIHFTFDYAVTAETVAADYLNEQIDIEGLKSIFLSVDETHDSIMKKKQTLQLVLEKFPRFRAGLLQLAVTYLQLGRLGEAQEVLQRHREIDRNDATVSYYLSAICLERLDYNNAWKYLEEAEALTRARNHFPQSLKELRYELRSLSPSCN